MSALDTFAIQVVELYLSHVAKRIRTRCTAKVNVELLPGGTASVGPEAEVATVRWPFGFDLLEGADDVVKKRLLLDALHQALKLAARTYMWEQEALEQAYAASIAGGLVYSGFLLERPLRHPRLPASANCYFEFDAKTVHLYVVLFNRERREVGRRPIYETAVGYDLARNLLDSFKWVGSDADKIRFIPGRNLWGEHPITVDVSDILSRIQQD